MSLSDQSNGMVWKRSLTAGDNQDVWDDSALIDAYDKAVKEVNRRIADKANELSASQRDKVSSMSQSWHCGQYCRCAYTEDGIEYEAQIVSINSANDTCLVRYIGYGNEESKSLKQLKTSLGKRARTLQVRQVESQEIANSGSDNEICSDNTGRPKSSQSESHPKVANISSPPNWFMPPLPQTDPIVPPPLPSHSSLPSDDESLASMLMSWYMSGYHTGYYRALKQCGHSSNK